MYSISFTKTSLNFFDKLSNKEREIILKKINCIRNEPFRYVKKLHGNKLWRFRVNDFRAILDIVISGRTIVVVRIGHRKNIYD